MVAPGPVLFHLILLVCIHYCTLLGISQAQLQVGFYGNTCPDVESIVTSAVRDSSLSNPNTAAVLLRLHFHGCFVQVCDGSILIEQSGTAERYAFGHQGVGGFEVIKKAKAQLERVCPGVVSCADIVALAVRDAIVLANGPSYQVPTGRRDGIVSNVSAANSMPDLNDSVQQLKAKFFDRGLSEKDLVVLNGWYTVLLWSLMACLLVSALVLRYVPMQRMVLLNVNGRDVVAWTCCPGE